MKKKTETRFKKTIFENGLTLVTERLPGLKSLSIGAWVKIGTRHESPANAGVSHFLEHMLFKGTRRRSSLEIAREIDRVGGEFNAFTARENTCFHLLLLNRDYELGLDILSDVLLNSQFREDEFQREKKVILQEIAMVEETPEELSHDLYFEHIYRKHGLGRPILGTYSSITRMKRSQITQFFHEYYVPEHIVISVAGDLSHEQVKKAIKPLLCSPWKGRPQNRKSIVRPEAISRPPFEHGFWWTRRPTEQVHLIWGVQGPHYRFEKRFAAFLLNIYLGGGMSSSLFQAIREKHGLAYTVYSSLSPFSDSGVFSIYAATGAEQIPLCLRLIEDCVEKIKKKALSKKELQIIQDNLKGTILLNSDSAEARMSSIAKNEIFLGRYVSTEQACQLVDEVTPKDLQEIAHHLFREDRRSILAYGPKPKNFKLSSN